MQFFTCQLKGKSAKFQDCTFMNADLSVKACQTGTSNHGDFIVITIVTGRFDRFAVLQEAHYF